MAHRSRISSGEELFVCACYTHPEFDNVVNVKTTSSSVRFDVGAFDFDVGAGPSVVTVVCSAGCTASSQGRGPWVWRCLSPTSYASAPIPLPGFLDTT